MGQCPSTVLVTGAGGFLGRHLLDLLTSAPDGPGRVVALDVRSPQSPDDDKHVQWVQCDLTDRRATADVQAAVRPEGLIHLAGVMGSAGLAACFAANVLAAENVLAAARQLARPPRVVIVGSAAQYGITTGENEIVDESRPLLAASAYGVSKIMQEQWALAYAVAGMLSVVCVRPFNIIGPGQPETLVPAAFLYQMADVLARRAGEITVGNTATRRDFTDVRDVVSALWLLMQADSRVDGQVVNIASGTAVSIADILDACVELGGRGVPVRQDPARMKAFDVPAIVGDNSRLISLTGWRPRIPWRQSLAQCWDEILAHRSE